MVVQAIMVNVVNYEMVRGIEDLAVHFDAFAVFFADGVVFVTGTFCEPGEPVETGVVVGIDYGELSTGERYEAGCVSFGVGGT